MKKAGINSLNAAVLDLGLSSFALEDPGRGLSHRFSAPLDMRFNPISDKLTAAQAIEGLSLEELARVLKRFGEQPSSRKIATRIKAERPNTTGQLAKIIVSLVPASDREKSLARVFQALRIYVNRELERLSLFLKTVPHIMSSGGRLAIISYHSLEDRMVKEFLQRESKDCICPPHFPVCQCLHQATFKIITAKPIRPTEGEITQNPRARSARLRVGERL
jgi:16S rRNA (cytosine1402-N4)-methyltransferase